MDRFCSFTYSGFLSVFFSVCCQGNRSARDCEMVVAAKARGRSAAAKHSRKVALGPLKTRKEAKPKTKNVMCNHCSFDGENLSQHRRQSHCGETAETVGNQITPVTFQTCQVCHLGGIPSLLYKRHLEMGGCKAEQARRQKLKEVRIMHVGRGRVKQWSERSIVGRSSLRPLTFLLLRCMHLLLTGNASRGP